MFMGGDYASRMMGGDPFGQTVGADGSIGGLQERARPAVVLGYRYDDVYRERREDGAHSGLRRRVRLADISVPVGMNSTLPMLQLEIGSSDILGGLLYSARDRARLQGNSESFMMTYSMNLSRSLRWNLGFGRSLNSSASPQEYAGGIVFQSGGSLLTLSVESRGYLQSAWLNIVDVQGVLPLDYRETGLKAGVTLPVGEGRVQVSAHHGFVSSLAQATREWDTRIVPAGLSEGFAASVAVPISPTWLGLLVLEGEILGGEGVFYSRASMYASVKAGSYKSTAVVAALRFAPPQKVTVVADLQYRSMAAGVDGFAESWPFVSVLASPVAQREYFEVRGSLSFWQLHVGTTIPVGEHVALGFGANGVRLLPGLQVNSWESRFLSIGRRAYKERVLPMKLVDGVFASSGINVAFSFATLQYSITQFIPVRVLRVEPTGGQGSISSRSSTQVRSGGGQFHTLVLSCEI